MTTSFHVSKKNEYDLIDDVPVIVDELPAGFYALNYAPPSRGLYLSRIDDFTMPDRLYGDIGARADRIQNTFNSRNAVTGLLLTGEKGSGKTLLAKKVAMDLLKEKDMPVIVVNFPVSGDEFGIFLQRIGKPVTLFFDEFEKVYSDEGSQNGLLTLLDGVYPMKIMAILTANKTDKVVDPLINRPGRIFYKMAYHGLDFSFVREYAEEKLVNKDNLSDLLRIAALVELNFDQLQALIEEMNRYDEGAMEAVQYLNITVEAGYYDTKIVSITDDEGNNIARDRWHNDYFTGDLSSEGDDVVFGYYGANDDGVTPHDVYDSDYELFYAMQRTFGSYVVKSEHITVPYEKLPMVVEFLREEMKIDVNDKGEIILTDPDTKAKVVLVRKSRDTRKKL